MKISQLISTYQTKNVSKEIENQKSIPKGTENKNIQIQKLSEKINNENINLENKKSVGKYLIDFNEHVKEKNFAIQVNYFDYHEKSKINELITNHSSVFAKDKYDIGTVRDYEAHVDLIADKYSSKRPYRCTIEDRRKFETQISKLLKKNVIEESYSPFAAPVTLAYKKDEDKRSRLCIDFRHLNKLAVPQSQPFPRIEDLVTRSVFLYHGYQFRFLVNTSPYLG